MGLKEIRRRAIECLLAGKVQAENRPDVKEKNLLKTGVVSVAEVIGLLEATRGSQYETIPHMNDPSVDVHIFKPIKNGEQWYVKLYFLEPDCWFISVHKSDFGRKGAPRGRKHGFLQRRR